MLLTKKSPGMIFISYRRDDARGIAGRLMDTLSDYFGDGRVFRDIEGIEGGRTSKKCSLIRSGPLMR